MPSSVCGDWYRIECAIESFVARILPGLDFAAEDLCQLLRNGSPFPVDPFHAVGVGEEANLLIDRQHVQSFANHLPDRVGKEIVPPVTGQAEVG